MTLTIYQIRNEHGLADKELYQSSDKEDAEALLDGSSMAGLVGLLRQLGDLAEFAGEVFHNLHEELMITSARGKCLANRLQQLDAEVPSSVEIPILSQTAYSTFFDNPGLVWHSNLQTDENLISPTKLPHCIMDPYEECRGPPQLYLLDKFDVDGSGSCLKRYCDPSLLKTLTASSVLATSKLSKDERPCKAQKKVSHTGNEERLGDSQTSHSKLHQLLLEEHVEKEHTDPEFQVRLKRRHLNRPPINSISSGKGYMEKFLKNFVPYCARVHESLDQSSSAMETEVTECNIPGDLSTLSLFYSSNRDTKKEREMEAIADDERPYVEGGATICVEGNTSVNFCGREKNDTDAPASTETEAKEADGDDKSGANEDVTQTEVLASNVLYHSSEGGESSVLKLTQVPVDTYEDGTKALQIDYVEDDHPQHVFSVETESELSLTGLVEDQFSTVTNQETAEESDCLLIQNQHISTFDSAAPEENEANSQAGYYMNTEQSGHISTCTPMLDTGNMNPSTSSWREDALANSDTAEISSDSGQEDQETMSIIAAESLPPQDCEIEAFNTPQQGTITSMNGNISESVLSMAPFSTSLHETQIPQEDLEITPPLPPLPPTQWWMGKLVDDSVKKTETQFSPVLSLAYNGINNFYIHGDENTQNGLVQLTKAQDPSEAPIIVGENKNYDAYTVEAVSISEQKTQNEPYKATEEEQPPSESVAWVSLLTTEATLKAESTEGLEALEWFSQNLKEHTNPNLAKLEEEPQLDHPLETPGEIEGDNKSYEQNEKVENLPRDKGSFVIGINKSMLRNVFERNRTQLGDRVEENDSLLEIIRSKSFNLRPADVSVRHNFQGAVSTTNLKVAAILEKANSLRHAMAGSDDDHDSDSWSE